MDGIACKLYSIGTTQAKMNTYLAYFAGYIHHLASEFAPLIAALPDPAQQQRGTELLSEL